MKKILSSLSLLSLFLITSISAEEEAVPTLISYDPTTAVQEESMIS